MIVIVPTGGSNITSVKNALARIGCQYKVTEDIHEITNASKVILPGVGYAANAMQNIEKAKLLETIKALSQPTLGICLGMQLLFENLEEGPIKGLGKIKGTVKKMSPRGLPLPHMGWNNLNIVDSKALLLKNITKNDFFYFVHSYRAPSGIHVLGYTDYGEQIPAVVQKDNFYGVQFHPEKSAASGEKILQNFIGL